MIFSDECWLKGECNKYLNKDAECKSGNVFCMKLFKLDTLYNLALIPPSQRKHMNLMLDASMVDEKAFMRLKWYQDNIESLISNGFNLYIYSTITGNGKTCWAIRLVQQYFNRIWYKTDLTCRALFINVPRYLLAIKDNISQVNEYATNIKDRVLDADLVVWDDIGTKAATSFEHENLLSIIDARISNGKSNIFTSNIVPDGLKELAGDRLYSRIVNFSDCIPFYGEDKRGLIK